MWLLLVHYIRLLITILRSVYPQSFECVTLRGVERFTPSMQTSMRIWRTCVVWLHPHGMHIPHSRPYRPPQALIYTHSLWVWDHTHTRARPSHQRCNRGGAMRLDARAAADRAQTRLLILRFTTQPAGKRFGGVHVGMPCIFWRTCFQFTYFLHFEWYYWVLLWVYTWVYSASSETPDEWQKCIKFVNDIFQAIICTHSSKLYKMMYMELESFKYFKDAQKINIILKYIFSYYVYKCL